FLGKAKACCDALNSGTDLVYLHMEAPDECGHQGDLEHKIYSIEQIDKVTEYILNNVDGEFSLLIMPDHPTPIAIKTHTATPVPYLIYRSNEVLSGANGYDEQTAKNSGIFVEKGHELILKLLNK
ncbi:MAG: phosphoglycerate mutase, partial [Clostridia bacterium]|nr:phosphoglycerate mutase [Clostridia bacterium]